MHTIRKFPRKVLLGVGTHTNRGEQERRAARRIEVVRKPTRLGVETCPTG
jgi:hypothetical protein